MRQKFGKYELVEVLGEGGMAEVFLARVAGPMGVSRFVALKRIHPFKSVDAKLVQMFIDEARLVVRLIHPNIVAVQDFGVEDHSYFLAMEYCEGQDLRHVLQRASETKRSVPVDCALYIIAGIARGLHYAHSLLDGEGRPLEIIHRDVSPSNILITYTGDVKLADFGIARASAAIRQHATEAGTIKGKICYMSPEQARGEPIDHRSDLFPLGTMLLELLTLSSAFKGDSDMTSLRNVQSGVPRYWDDVKSNIPDDVMVLLDKIMTVDRRDRVENGATLAQEIEVALRRRNPGFGPRDLQTYMESLFSVERAQQRERLGRYERGAEEESPPTVDIEIDRRGSSAGEGLTRTVTNTPSARLPNVRPHWARNVAPAAAALAFLAVGSYTVGNAWRRGARDDGALTVGTTNTVPALAVVQPARAESGPPHAPSGDKAMGKVMLSTNAIGTRVFLDRSGGPKSTAAVAAGGMSLRVSVPADVDWTLRVEADGFTPVTMPLRIGAGEEMTIPLGLAPLQRAAVSPPAGSGKVGKHTAPKGAHAPSTTPSKREEGDGAGKSSDNGMVDPF